VRTTITGRARIAVSVLAAAALAAGCASSADDSDSSDTTQLSQDEIYVNGLVGEPSDDEPVDGGTLTIAEYSEARSLDPTKTIPNGAVGGNAMAAVYDTLLRYDVDSATFEPQLAESLESDDDTTWTLTLREGVTFTDGTPLDAVAVVSSMGYYLKSGGFGALAVGTNVKDMKPVDERTVVFTLNGPWKTFPAVLAGGAGMIMAPASYDDPEKFEPIGAGPFVFDSYKPGEELTLAANEDYWDGAPHLDGLRFIWLGGDETRLEAVETGTADMAYVRSAKVVEDARNQGFDGAMTVLGIGNMLWMNNREGALSDVRVRQAISYAIDRELYTERVQSGAGLPTGSIVPEQSAYHQDVELAEYDPEKAKELLEAAKEDGFDGKLTYLGQSDQLSKTASVTIKGMLEAVGFEVEIESLRNVADQVQRLYVDHTFDLATSSMSVADEEQYTRYFSNIGSTSLQNPSGYANPEMDALIDELQTAASEAETASVLARINEMWQETQPGVVLASGASFYPWNDDVHGVVPTAEQIVLFDKAWKG
jgi:peptide/nickel transport system substrate-binding protein